jgi:enamine deaminase RidA (YjgF/YER057c/UK114 family)
MLSAVGIRFMSVPEARGPAEMNYNRRSVDDRKVRDHRTSMRREIAEQIMAAMKGLDPAFGHLDEAVRCVEDEEERRTLLRVLGGLFADTYHHLMLPIVNQFPDLYPDAGPPFRPIPNFRPGLPVRRLDPGSRLSEATIHDERMYLSGITPEDTSQDITGQTKQVLAEIEVLLKKGGSHCTKILSALIFLADMDDFAAMNAAWDDWIVVSAAPPARATVQAKLSDPTMKIEIMVVAAL